MLSKVESELEEDKHKEEQRKQRVKEQIEEEKRHRFSQLNAWKVSKSKMFILIHMHISVSLCSLVTYVHFVSCYCCHYGMLNFRYKKS